MAGKSFGVGAGFGVVVVSAAVVGLGAAWWLGRRAVDDGALDPTSDQNLIYKHFFSGDDWSLGTKVYDWLH